MINTEVVEISGEIEYTDKYINQDTVLVYNKECLDKLIQIDVDEILGINVTKLLIKCSETMKEKDLDEIYMFII